MKQLAREPLIHFFLVGVLLFAASSWMNQEERTIVITPGIRADLARRYEDLHGSAPTEHELRQEVQQWRREEALHREALRRGLEQNDAAVRSALINKMHTLVALQVAPPQPTRAELETWLVAHRDRYERPLRYRFEFIEFDSTEQAELGRFSSSLAEGKQPSSMGRPVRGGHLTNQQMRGRIPKLLVETVLTTSESQSWQKVEGEKHLWLVRVLEVTGGLPGWEALEPTLVADFTQERQSQAVERELDRVVEQYRFEGRP